MLAGEAARLGFDALGMARPEAIASARSDLEGYLDAGHHGTMEWMARTAARRGDPRELWPEVRTIISVAMNYGPAVDPRAELANRRSGTISVYARNRDYHDVMKGRLKQLAGRLVAATDAEVKVFVDTAPVMEKPLAAAAGIGWQGKHTNLVSRRFGSWLFLGEIFSAAEIAPDEPETDHCGSCRACLDICPTRAFPAPHRIDARRCISYLTIEHKGHVPRPLREAIGNRIFGCDDCLAVCPWNKFAAAAREARLIGREDLAAPDLGELAALDDAAFRRKFSGSPVKRIGHHRFLRNVLIAIGNSADRGLAGAALAHLAHRDAIVRGAAVWALARLSEAGEFARLREEFAKTETDPHIRGEWKDGSAPETV